MRLLIIALFLMPTLLISESFENFEYTSREKLLKAWQSKNFLPFKTLDDHPYYYYPAKIEGHKSTAMCVALRTNPIGVKPSKDFKPYKKGKIRAIQIYKKVPKYLQNIGKLIANKKDLKISWEWNTIIPPRGADDYTKSDNSFAIYIVLDAGFYTVKYIKYTWSPNENIKIGYNKKLSNGTRFVIVKRTAKDKNNVWFKETVNISKDIKTLFPKKYKKFKFVAIGILSDSDDAQKPILSCIDNIKYTIK